MRWIRLSIVASVLGGLALYLLNRVAGWWPVFTALSIHVATGTLIFGLERLLPTSLPDGYYRLRRVERGGTVYRRLGVPAFRRAVLASVFGRSPLVQFGGTRADLVRYLQVTRNAEMGHLLLLHPLSRAGSGRDFQRHRRAHLEALVLRIVDDGIGT